MDDRRYLLVEGADEDLVVEPVVAATPREFVVVGGFGAPYGLRDG